MIKVYTIHNYFICALTGQVFSQISFNGSPHDKTFPSVEYAKNFLQKSKKDWFLQSLEDFVNHKKLIINNSQVSPEKQKALQVCIEAYNTYCNKSLEAITSGFLRGKKYFEAILPHTSNDSHESSLNNLNELIKFCETESNKEVKHSNLF